MTQQKTYFNELADFLTTQLQGEEIFTSSLSGEESDFVRFNHGKIRQPGNVKQYSLSVDLILGQKHAGGALCLCGDASVDQQRLQTLITELREKLPHLPDDPHLLFSQEINNSTSEKPCTLPNPQDAINDILELGSELDMVGIYAQGTLHRGFANSLGQRNWFSSSNFNFDWCLYSHGDKAVKCSHAGLEWDKALLDRKFESAKEQLPIIGKEAKTIAPGKYRVYLAPAAMHEIMGLLCWTSFSRKAQETKQSPLLKLLEGIESFHPQISIVENTAGGIGPNFESSGFIKKPQVPLIEKGKFCRALTSPRSSKEYGGETDGANSSESPQSLHVNGGSLKQESILQELGTGLYISNLWYLNFSDAMSCRMTGMTRFATFWVENGEIVAPLNVMRFDESMYRALSTNLIGLTSEQEFIFDTDTYFERSCSSAKLPGALIDDFCFTL